MVADRQQFARRRATGNEDKRLVLKHEPLHEHKAGSQEFRHARASDELIRSRVAVAHAPDGVGSLEKHGALGIRHDPAPGEVGETVMWALLIHGTALSTVLEHLHRLVDQVPSGGRSKVSPENAVHPRALVA